MKPLYIQKQLPVFEKNAAEVTLPDDPNTWANELIQELYKQTPYVADFDASVEMDKVDDERGTGLGVVLLRNKTEMQNTQDDAGRKAIGIRQVRIPVVISDGKLQPFDLLVMENSQMLPLTEQRLRQAMFRPQAFDVTSRTPGDQSMVGQLFPPYRQNYGFGGAGATMGVGMGKEGADASSIEFHDKMKKILGLSDADVAKMKADKAPAAHASQEPTMHGTIIEGILNPGKKKQSAAMANSTTPTQILTKVKDLVPKVKHGSLLKAVLPTMYNNDFVTITESLAALSGTGLIEKNASGLGRALEVLSQFEDNSQAFRKMASDVLPHDVLQIRHLDTGGYEVKYAYSAAWDPKSEVVDRGTLVKMAGEKVALDVDLNGSVTSTNGPTPNAKGEDPESAESKPENISSFGMYRVKKEEDGQELVGYVFPNLMDTDGEALPIALFTNGSVTALQDAIVGDSVGSDSGLVFGPHKGHGMFVRQLPNGKVDAVVPMSVISGYSVGEDKSMKVKVFDGREMFVKVQPNLTHPTESDDMCLIPDTFKWMPLGGDSVNLISDPAEWSSHSKTAEAEGHVTLRAWDNDNVLLSGEPIEKMGSSSIHTDLDEAAFLFAGFGTDLKYLGEKIGESVFHNTPVKVKIGRQIQTYEQTAREATKTAMARLSGIPDLRVNLAKEAAFIPDPLAVDTVLSLGFINPENIETFIAYLPVIDESQSKLCELLMASRLGLSVVPKGALEKAIKSTEEVINGLKVLAFQKQ